MAENKLDNKVALVTGGSNGIGLATVKMLAIEGANVIVGYYNGEDRARELIENLPGKNHEIFQIKLEDSSTSETLAKQIEEKYGHLDIIVNSAGFTKPIAHKDIEKLDIETFDSILLANARGPYSIIRSLMPMLEKSHDAVVINVSSISAFTGSGSNIAYCASKAAVDTMTMSLARVFGPKIRFLCVSPAAVATDFVQGRDRNALELLAEKTPLKKVVEPDDVALAIMACITHLKTATGTRIVVDGGKNL
jgi:3-oxoacyl-[acyl-carrier protein] reductase